MGTPKPLAPRFWAKVQVGQPDECWPWTACKESSSGYGRVGAGFALGGPTIWKAHRVAWTLDACPHRGCVNPSHLEPVTHQENALRRELRRTHFKCGHSFSDRVRNGGGGRCGVCNRGEIRAARQRAALERRADL